MKYQPREGRDSPKQWSEEEAFPYHIDVADEIELPSHIHRTFAGDLIRNVDAVGCPRVTSLGYHTASLFLRPEASKGWADSSAFAAT